MNLAHFGALLREQRAIRPPGRDFRAASEPPQAAVVKIWLKPSRTWLNRTYRKE
jgi:hypothetical protein